MLSHGVKVEGAPWAADKKIYMSVYAKIGIKINMKPVLK
jgi:hypothetical protein